jgi:DNA-binding NarL/FixJ family response regulator
MANPFMSASAVQILLVDDHTILRRGLRLVLEKLPGIKAVSEAGSCPAALEQITADTPDVVILDAHLPEMNGIEGASRILDQHPGIKIIMLSGDSSARLILDALRAGALAYVIKENSPEEIWRAIQSVMAGKAYFSPEVATAIARYCRENALTPASATIRPALSESEKRLLQLVAQGKRNKEIAVHLNVSTKSVEAYRSRLMNKLECASPAELTRFAIREGIAKL